MGHLLQPLILKFFIFFWLCVFIVLPKWQAKHRGISDNLLTRYYAKIGLATAPNPNSE